MMRSASAAAKRLITFLLGRVSPLPIDPDWRRRAALVCVFGAVAMAMGDQIWFASHPLITGSWRLAIHAGIPMMAVVLIELWGQRRGWLLAGLGSAILLATFAAWGLGAGPWWRENPLGVILPCLLGVVLQVAGLVRGGWDPVSWNAGLGDWRWWVPRTLLATVLLIPGVAVVVSVSPGLLDFYPRWKPARESVELLWVLNAGNGLDFIAWEWLFRGYLMMALARSGRPWMAIAVQTIPFWLLHYPKPPTELWLSLVGGFIAGWFCYRARTFWPLFLLHTIQMSTTNVTGFLARQAG